MVITRNQPCPCGSGKRYKKCCAVKQNNYSSSASKGASSLVSEGIVLLEQGFPEQALRLYQEALSLNPKDALIYFNIGGVLRKLGRIEEAAANFEKVLDLQPDDAEVSVILGYLYTQLGLTKDADASFQKGLAHEPKTAKGCVEFGDFLGNFGWVEEVEAYYRKALLLKPEYAEAYCNLGDSLMVQGKMKEASASFRNALVSQSDYPKVQIFLAICAWINGDWEACRKCLNLTFNTSNMIGKDEGGRFIFPYYYFLEKLIEYRKNNSSEYVNQEDLPAIYCVGDSHTLSIVNTKINFRGIDYCAKAKIIIGCKAWHLGNDEKNRYKYSFEKAIESIPVGATVIVNIGEIDCRRDAGIIKNHRATGNNLTESIVSLVYNYIDYIVKICRPREIKPLICNIPVRLIGTDKVSESDKGMLKTVLGEFNRELADNCAKRHIKLLDVNTLSKNNDGTPSDECHLDNFHLLPSVFERLIRES
jgi:tetratricopeptide (TPR) repeat protein